MSSPVLSLLVEDDATALKYRKRHLERVGFTVIEAKTYTEAINAYRSAPALDLVVCDVNLDAADQWNRGGIEVAEEMRADDADLPIAGYSTILAEEKWIGDNPFSHILISNLPLSQLRAELQKLYVAANAHRDSRLMRSQERFDKYLRDTRFENRHRPELLSRFSDPALDKVGFELKIVEPGVRHRGISGAERTIAHPIPLWIQRTNDIVIAELYRFPVLFGTGNTEPEAMDALFLLMDGFLHDLAEPCADGAKDAPMLRDMHSYLKRVFGSDG